jgi:hypothetical protein
VKTKLSISIRTVTALALVLGVFFVPLAHAAHFHAGDAHDDANVNATCVVCSVAQGSNAECVMALDLPDVSLTGADLPAASEVDRHSILLLTKSSRAPPASHV